MASVMIWPIDPVIENGRRAGSLWIENKGDKPVVMQLRIVRWSQEQGEDRFDNQTDVVASPPFAEIVPGARQMVRLTLTGPVADGENAYRVIVDEIPANPALPANATEGTSPLAGSGDAVGAAPEARSAGLRFQMRYSLPLFVYAGSDRSLNRQNPVVNCTIKADGGASFLHIANSSQRHAKLTNVWFERGSVQTPLGRGLFGYALAGGEKRGPLPQGVTERDTLHLTMNGAAHQLPGCARK